MEIPETTLIASREVVDMIVEEEVAVVKQEMRDAAEAYERQKAEEEAAKREREQADKLRRRGWAQSTIVRFARSFLARKVLRQKAYERYRKYFDVVSGNYYYADARTGLTSWDKPPSLGAYDIDVASPSWVVMLDSEGDPYFYHPRSWAMSVEQPRGTVLCQSCGRAFAVARYQERSFCENCFNTEVNGLLASGLEASSLFFQPIEGGLEGCSDRGFRDCGELSWQGFLEGMEAARPGVDEEPEESEEDGVVCDGCENEFASLSCEQVRLGPGRNHLTDLVPTELLLRLLRKTPPKGSLEPAHLSASHLRTSLRP